MRLSKTRKRFIRKHHRELTVAQIARRLNMRPAQVESALAQLGLRTPDQRHDPHRATSRTQHPRILANISARLEFLNRYTIAFLIVVGLALVIRLLHLIEVVDTPFFQHLHTDPAMYKSWAVQIAEGDWLGKSRPVFYLGPLYPYFLAVIYSLTAESNLAVGLVQIILSSVSAGLVYHLGRRLFGAATGLVAGLLAAFYGMFVFYSGLILGATLIILLSLLMLVLLDSGLRKPAVWKWLAAGVCFGLSACGRGSVVLFGPPAVIAMMAGFGFGRWKKWLPAGAWFALSFFLTISPVTLHNLLIGDDLVLLTSNAGTNLFIGNHARSRGLYMTTPRYKGRPMGLSVRDQQANFPRVATQELQRDDLKSSEVSRFWAGKTVEEIRRDLGRWLALEGNKLKHIVNAYELPNNRNYYFSQRFSLLLRMPLASYGLILPLAIAGMIISWRRWRAHGLLYAFLLAQTAGLLAFFVIARYRLVMVPILLIYAGVTLTWLCKQAAVLRLWRPAILVVLLIPLYALTYQKVPRTNFRANYLNLAHAYRDLGQPELALENYDRALAISPGYYYALFKKGQVLARMGRRQQAAEALERALNQARRNQDVVNIDRIERELRNLNAD